MCYNKQNYDIFIPQCYIIMHNEVNRMIEPWKLAAMDEAGYNGITEKHLQKVAAAINKVAADTIDNATFERCCRQCGIDPENFTQANLDRLQEILDGED